MTKILIIEARFYPEIADLLLDGAKNALAQAGAEVEIVSISGSLEIPAVIAAAKHRYDGFVALGTVLRGETYHFEIVANESARGIMDLTLQGLAIGNGILTCETEAQAIERAGKYDKGGFAAKACLELIKIKQDLK
jgi:6,7-dimethyl-8-ribityllumazine synthase